MKSKLNTTEALRTAIANIWAIHEYDHNKWTPDLHNAIHIMRNKLKDLTMVKIEEVQ